MNTTELTSLLVSDFTLDVLAGYLNNDTNAPKIKAVSAPFGQIIQVLADKGQPCWQQDLDFAVIWTRPESVVESFRSVMSYERTPLDKTLAEVDEFCEALLKLRNRVEIVFVPTWALPSYHKGYGLLDMTSDIGFANTLMKMNLRLADNLEGAQNIYLLNTQKWIENAGKKAFSPELWYMAKMAFGNEVLEEAAKDLKSALRAISGSSRKLIIVDLDDTIWGGVVGEDGWSKLRLGGHDPLGEAFVEFQAALKSLTNRGVLLGIVSKNDETTALEAIQNHPEMVLTLRDFAGWRINWGDKAHNILDLVSELALGLQSVVFIDNDPIERGRVREALPEVFVPEWPQKKTLYKSTLLSLSCFDTPSISQEDRERTKMYVSERERQISRKKIGSLEDWLKTLATKVEVEELNDANLPRVVQLLNKTNQLNLSTRRMTERELQSWALANNRKFWVIRVLDRFGDSGLSGLVSLEIVNNMGRIIDFVLSCRVMGRKIEETMLYIMINYARSLELGKLCAKYIPTSKNRPCLDFWQKSGFVRDGKDNIFSWDLRQPFPHPGCVEIEMRVTQAPIGSSETAPQPSGGRCPNGLDLYSG
jgi:FkbH-like protein